MTGMTRRAFCASAAASGVLASGCMRPVGSATQTISNPLIRQRADAQITRQPDGSYLFTASVPEYDRVILRRAPTIGDLATAPEAVLWRRPATGRMAGHIWAPEIHRIDDRWYVYVAAGDSDDVFRTRTYVLQCDDADPIAGRWSVLGQFQTPWDSFTLDSTVFVHRGVRYIAWAQREPGIETNSNLYLAPLATPLTLAAKPALLTVPTLDWEVRGFKVAEAAAVLNRNGRLFMTYSASATDDRYCLGMLTADENANLMDPKSWTKSQQPVFVSSEATSVYGPGHNSFTVDEQGRDVLVYHGRDYKAIKGDPLFDPNRHTRVQRIYYRADGTPDFGIPVGNGPVPDRYSPIDQANLYLRYEGGKVVVGEGDIPGSQFRALPGLAGGGSISLEPITERGRVVVAGPDGTLGISPQDRSADFNARASFVRRPSGTKADQVTFESVATPGALIVHADGGARVAPAAKGAAATFRIS